MANSILCEPKRVFLTFKMKSERGVEGSHELHRSWEVSCVINEIPQFSGHWAEHAPNEFSVKFNIGFVIFNRQSLLPERYHRNNRYNEILQKNLKEKIPLLRLDCGQMDNSYLGICQDNIDSHI